MPISELKLAKELIRKPSITPRDAGAINLLAKNLRSLGFNCKIINFKNIKNLYAKRPTCRRAGRVSALSNETNENIKIDK